MSKQAIELVDLKRLAEGDVPELVAAIQSFLQQEHVIEDRPDDAMTLGGLQTALEAAGQRWSKKERQTQAHEAWKRYLSQAPGIIDPQIGLAELVVALYEKKTPGARAALLLIAEQAPLAFGLWGGLKRVYKRAEKDLDAPVFATLAVRFEMAMNRRGRVGKGTIIYLRRRAARFLRLLGKASSELYPQFAIEVLRRHPDGMNVGLSRTAERVITPLAKKWGAPGKLPRERKFRAPYQEAWQRSPDPLMLLLETCGSDMAASFAIDGLRELFPDVLRKVSVEWLGRLAHRPLPSAHDFLVATLQGSPEFHQGKLAALGLKDAVLALLGSRSKTARLYAVEYARAHASDLASNRLVEILAAAVNNEAGAWAASVLMGRPPRELGVALLGQLLGYGPTMKWANEKLESEFEPKEIGEDFLLAMLLDDDDDRQNFAQRYIKKKFPKTELPFAFWLRVLDDPRLEDRYGIDEFALERLAKYPLASIPGDWILGALVRDDIGDSVGEWLSKAKELPPSIDLERIRGLVFDPSKREIAFSLLGNPKLVPPRDVGLPWLLAVARRADPALHGWAHRYILQHVKPGDFAEGKKSDLDAGVDRLFALAGGTKEPEAIRAFAQLYLSCHHPKIGKRKAETKDHGIKPAIPREAYTEARVWPLLFDARPDVRKFAVTIARVELRTWGAQGRVYELAESNAKEVRNVAYDALLQAGDPDGDPEIALTLEELDAAQIFSMTESRRRASRDVAMDLIRKHYRRLGGAERLGWLMQSADREVRLFAVRLLWEKHRPRAIPSQWKTPATATSPGRTLPSESFEDVDALRALLRRLLFMVPPNRSMEKAEAATSKKLSASIAKRRVIEIVRDLGVADETFAQVAAPVLGEFTGSIAKGEWEACLAALVTLRQAHGIAVEGLV